MDSKARQPEPAPASPPSDAFERRLEEHVGLLRRFVRAKAGRVVRAKEPVSDLVQSIVREACGAPLRGDENDDAFRSWLCTIAAHKIISKNRFYSAERRDAASIRRTRPRRSVASSATRISTGSGGRSTTWIRSTGRSWS